MGHPRALWGEGMGWHGLGTQTECLTKPGGLQTPAWASQAVELGLPATWAPAVPPPLAPHSRRAAAPDVASFVDGGLSCQGSEPAGPPDTGLGSHWRDLSSLSQPGAASAVKYRSQRLPQALCSASEPLSWLLSPAASGIHFSSSWEIPSQAPLMQAEAGAVEALWSDSARRVPPGTSHFGSCLNERPSECN